MKNAKSKALENKLAKGEKEAIRDYRGAIKDSDGKKQKVYKHILPEEEEHLKELKKL